MSAQARAEVIAEQEVADALGADGALAQALTGFNPRPVQQQMASAVAAAISARSTLVAEAGTGTGKTYAYLVPVLLARRKAIISTGTRTLQDQLFHRDLPRVVQALDVSPRVALLKGRSNYLCHYRLAQARQARSGQSMQRSAALQQISEWAEHTRSGDLAELPQLPEESSLVFAVTSNVDNCLGGECPHYEDCFLLRARRRAQEADIVVVNHHLLFADMALKQEGFAELLPATEVVVIDEAHQLAETATRFFGQSFSSHQLHELIRDSRHEAAQQPGALAAVDADLDRLQHALAEMRLVLDGAPKRGVWAQQRSQSSVASAWRGLGDALARLISVMEPLAAASRGLDACYGRARAKQLLLQRLLDQDPDGWVSWYELYRTGLALHCSPLDVAEPMQTFRSATKAAWVFTSATLAVGDSFALFNQQLGLSQPGSVQLLSPFDYQRNALLYHPDRLPEPSAPDYVECLVEAALPVLDHSGGRAFFLFTSHRNLQAAAALLRARTQLPLFVQGEQSRHRLLDAFRGSGCGVLLGAASFWEGVDVAGEALSLVVIDKLPFAAPDEPVLQARLQRMRKQGQDPFWDYQLPASVLALKQGAGRLIRDVNDRGVLMICDPRLATRRYGRVFRQSLPAMPYTRHLSDVAAFFAGGAVA